jgi:hypothetical protein
VYIQGKKEWTLAKGLALKIFTQSLGSNILQIKK